MHVYVYVYVYTYVYSTGTSEVLPEVLVHERVLSYNVRKYFRTFVLPKYNVVHIDSLSIISYVLVVHVRVGVQLYTYVYAYYCSVK